MFTLQTLRNVVVSGEYFNQADVDFANELIEKGYCKHEVIEYARGWDQEYCRVAHCEAAEARDFEYNAY